jgi:hypothetical protein
METTMTGAQVLSASAAMTLWLASFAGGITIPLIDVGNPGNPPDPATIAIGNLGSVSYPYRIGTYEVTNAEYVAFLNAVAASDPNQVFHPSMQATFNGGITRTGVSGAYTYAPKPGYADKPVVFASFFSAARFCNWLHNGQPVGPQSPQTTEDGAYTMLGMTAMAPGTGDGNGRNANWLWALPTRHEWHKAAYNGSNNTWTRYATQTDIEPVSEPPPGGTNSANYNGAVSLLTVRGAYVQCPAFWGAFDMNGNLAEWNEGANFVRRIRGGNWQAGSNEMRSTNAGSVSDGTPANNQTGFRVVQAVITTGACCLLNGSCVSNVTSDECLAQRGRYQGNGSNCASANCVSHLGACCFSDGTCTDGVSASQCAALGGLYRGDATVCASAGCVPIGAVLFVNAAAAPGGHGTSWADALKDLQDALTIAHAFPRAVTEIWVVTGTYYPDLNTGDQSMSFTLRNGLTVYGGFIGNETSSTERDPTVNVTILSGDLNGNDVFNLSPSNNTVNENSYHVVVAQDVDDTAVLDGFTIRSGRAYWIGVEDRGGGLLNESAAPTVQNCVFTWNRAMDGGGMANVDSDPTIINCVFRQNGNGARGGGMFNLDSNPTISGSDFIGNAILASLADGSAMYNLGSSPDASDCLFQDHESAASALYNASASDGTFVDCVFTGNEGREAAAVHTRGSDPLFTACDFTDNTTQFFAGAGGAMVIVGGNPEFSACTFVANHAGLDGGAVRITNGEPSTTGPVFTQCLFQNNTTPANGGAVSNDGIIAAAYSDCQFVGNTCSLRGGGMYNEDAANVTLTGCEFVGNTAGIAGGGAYHFNDGVFTLTDTSFSKDTAPLGNGLMNHRGMLVGEATLLSGDALVNGMNFRIAGDRLQQTTGAWSVAGDYRHALLGGGGDQSPVLFMDIGGLVPGSTHDVLSVAGTAQIDGGSLVLAFLDGFVPVVGDTFDLITASSVAGTFDLMAVTGLPTGLSADLAYLPTAVRATIVEAEPPIYTPSPTVGFDGTPTDGVAFDFDIDGFVDFGLVVGTGQPTQPGEVLVFRNAGVDARGTWLGFDPDPLVAPLDSQPMSIAAGLFDGGAFPDLVVANGTVVSLIQNLNGNGFVLLQNRPVGGEATSVDTANLVAGGFDDFVVSERTNGQVRVYRSTSAFVFSQHATLLPGVQTTAAICADVTANGTPDVITTNPSIYLNPPSLATVYANNNGAFPQSVGYAVGRGTEDVLAMRLDSDVLLDLVTRDRQEESISVLMNRPNDPGMFLSGTPVPLGAQPRSMASLDLDGDLDNDIVVVARPAKGPEVYLRGVINAPGPKGQVALSVQDLEPTAAPTIVGCRRRQRR